MTYTKKPYEQLTKEEKELVNVAKAYGFCHTLTFDTEKELGLLVTTPKNPYSDGLYKLFKNQTGNMVNFPIKVIKPQTNSSADSVTFAVSEIERCLLSFDPGLETADYVAIFTRLLDHWLFKANDQEPFKTLYMGQFLTEMAKMYNETNKSELFVNQDPYILKHAIKTNAIPKETLETIETLADKKMTFSHATDFDSFSSENVLN